MCFRGQSDEKNSKKLDRLYSSTSKSSAHVSKSKSFGSCIKRKKQTKMNSTSSMAAAAAAPESRVFWTETPVKAPNTTKGPIGIMSTDHIKQHPKRPIINHEIAALRDAVESNNQAVVKHYLATHADDLEAAVNICLDQPNAKHRTLDTALTLAIKYHHNEIAMMLLATNVANVNVDALTDSLINNTQHNRLVFSRVTCLMLAVISNNSEMAVLLAKTYHAKLGKPSSDILAPGYKYVSGTNENFEYLLPKAMFTQLTTIGIAEHQLDELETRQIERNNNAYIIFNAIANQLAEEDIYKIMSEAIRLNNSLSVYFLQQDSLNRLFLRAAILHQHRIANLLKDKVNPNAVNTQGNNALMLAVGVGNMGLASKLLKDPRTNLCHINNDNQLVGDIARNVSNEHLRLLVATHIEFLPADQKSDYENARRTALANIVKTSLARNKASYFGRIPMDINNIILNQYVAPRASLLK